MDKLYRGSQLTIAAVDSPDGAGGCFPTSPQTSVTEGEATFTLSTSSRSSSSPNHHLLVHVHISPSDTRRRTVDHTPLSTRGWTLQENILPQRLAFCMHPETHWGCQAGYQTQSGLVFAPDQMLSSGTPWMRAATAAATASTKAWDMIVQNYSRRGFTFPRDRIAALAGITQFAAGQNGDRAVLGLWERAFCRGLAWIRLDDVPELGYAALGEEMGVPSWSWLAALGAVDCDPWEWDRRGVGRMQKVVEQVELLSWDVQWKGTPFTSGIKSAEARVSGSVRYIDIAQSQQGNRFNPPYWNVFGESVEFDEGLKRFPWRSCGRFDAGAGVDVVAGSYFCLLVRSRVRRKSGDKDADIQEIFLILEPVGAASEGTCRRLGLGKITSKVACFDHDQTVVLTLV